MPATATAALMTFVEARQARMREPFAKAFEEVAREYPALYRGYQEENLIGPHYTPVATRQAEAPGRLLPREDAVTERVQELAKRFEAQGLPPGEAFAQVFKNEPELYAAYRGVGKQNASTSRSQADELYALIQERAQTLLNDPNNGSITTMPKALEQAIKDLPRVYEAYTQALRRA